MMQFYMYIKNIVMIVLYYNRSTKVFVNIFTNWVFWLENNGKVMIIIPIFVV